MKPNTGQIDNARRAVYLFLNGGDKDLCQTSKQVVAAGFGISLKKLHQVRAEYLAEKTNGGGAR